MATTLQSLRRGSCTFYSSGFSDIAIAETSTPFLRHCNFTAVLPLSTSSQNLFTGIRNKQSWCRRDISRRSRNISRIVGQSAERGNVSARASISNAVGEEAREDDVLPDSLHGAVIQSAEAAARLFESGGDRALVELLFPELESMANEGDQQRLWDLCKEFVTAFQENSGIEKIRVVFADAGAAAMLKYKWADASFEISSLNDRVPVEEEDEAAILVAPDHTALPDVHKVVKLFDEHEFVRPLVLWNPRLISGDVGVGLNVRRLREGMLGTFTVAYSLRSLPNGSVYRSYPEPWKVFFSDSKLPGRYALAGVSDTRPGPDEIDRLAMGESAKDSGREEPSAVDKAAGVFNSLSRFMKSLSS